MADQPKEIDVEAVVSQVEQAIKDGRTDSELELSREVRRRAMDALIQRNFVNGLISKRRNPFYEKSTVE